MRNFSKILALVLSTGAILGCGGGEKPPKSAARMSVFVTIEPLRYFAEQIGGPLVVVQALVASGQSPATYALTAREMTQLAEADLLLTIGVPMEKQLLPRIRRLFDQLTIVAAQAGLKAKTIEFDRDSAAGEVGSSTGHRHSAADLDPHVWLDPELARGIAQNVYGALAAAAPEHEPVFNHNLKRLDQDLLRLHSEIKGVLAPVTGKEMFVFHPAYGYFAEAFGLKQVAIEAGGVTPGSKHLADVIEMARARGVKAIFVQPQFSTTTAAAVAAAVGAAVVTLDPLAYDYADNMRKMAGDIRDALITD
jgi:zinc transport system substrate-binding protein